MNKYKWRASRFSAGEN